MTEHLDIAIEKIVPNRYQPRIVFDQESLFELAQSIRENGLIQPIVVRQTGDHYEIIAGERRYRAMMMSGHVRVPCIVIDADEQKSAAMALVENVQRENLSVIEEAMAYRDILRIQKMTQQQLADRLGKSQSNIANKIRLLELPEPVLSALSERTITERHGRALLGVAPLEAERLLPVIIERQLNVSQTEALIHKPALTKKSTIKGLSKNLKIGINSIKQTTEMIRKTGIKFKQEINETDEEVIVTIRFPK